VSTTITTATLRDLSDLFRLPECQENNHILLAGRLCRLLSKRSGGFADPGRHAPGFLQNPFLSCLYRRDGKGDIGSLPSNNMGIQTL